MWLVSSWILKLKCEHRTLIISFSNHATTASVVSFAMDEENDGKHIKRLQRKFS